MPQMTRLYYTVIFLLLTIIYQNDCSAPQYKYVMANLGRCQQEKPDVVMWVQGRASNPAQRAIIRELLANKRAWPKDLKIAGFFMVGVSNNRKLQIRLQYEFELYGDIVQNDYKEHYENQTAKMMSAITFLSDYCGQSKLAIRIDDDVLFHPSTMIRKVAELMTSNTTNTYDPKEDYHSQSSYRLSADGQYHLYNSSKYIPHKPVSSHATKNRLTNENTVLCHILSKRDIIRYSMKRPYPVKNSVLRGEKLYPDFCAGFFIAMSMDLLPKFKGLFALEPPFWIDDSYLGVLQKRLKTINVDASEYLLFNMPRETDVRQVVSSGTNTDVIAVHLMQGPSYYKHMYNGYMFEEI